MGSIRRLDTNVDIQSFPGAHFVINNEVPAAQCSEARIEGDTAATFTVGTKLVHVGKFASFNLSGKFCHIVTNPGGNIGDFFITGNNPNELTFALDPGNGTPTEYFVTDGGSLELTRNEASFAAYIQAAGYAYTFKGGRLFTNMPNGQLKNACTITWNPIT